MQWNPFNTSQYIPTQPETLPKPQANPNLVQQASPQQQLTLPPPPYTPPPTMSQALVPQPKEQSALGALGSWAITPLIPESAADFLPGPLGSIGRFATRMTSPAEIAFTAATLGFGASLGIGLRGATTVGKLATSNVPKIAQKPISWTGRAVANLIEPVYRGTPNQVALLQKAAKAKGTTFGSVKTSRGNIVPRTGQELALIAGAQFGFEQAAEPMGEAYGPVGGAIGTTVAGLTGGVLASLGGASAARAFQRGLQKNKNISPKDLTVQETVDFVDEQIISPNKTTLYDIYTPKIDDDKDVLMTDRIAIDEKGEIINPLLREENNTRVTSTAKELNMDDQFKLNQTQRSNWEKSFFGKIMEGSPRVFQDAFNKVQGYASAASAARNVPEQFLLALQQTWGKVSRIAEQQTSVMRATKEYHSKVYGELDEAGFIKINDGGWLTDDAIKAMENYNKTAAGKKNPIKNIRQWDHHRVEESLTGFARSTKDKKKYTDFGVLDKLGLLTDEMKDLGNRWTLNLKFLEDLGKSLGYKLDLKEEFLENNFDELYLKYGYVPKVDDLRKMLPEGVKPEVFDDIFVQGYVPRAMAEIDNQLERKSVGYGTVHPKTGEIKFTPVGPSNRFEKQRVFSSAEEARRNGVQFVDLSETKQMFMTNRLKRITYSVAAKFNERNSILSVEEGRASQFPFVFVDTAYGRKIKNLWKKQITDKRLSEQFADERAPIYETWEGGRTLLSEYIDRDARIKSLTAELKKSSNKKFTKAQIKNMVEKEIDGTAEKLAAQNVEPFLLSKLKEYQLYSDGFKAFDNALKNKKVGEILNLDEFKESDLNWFRDNIDRFPELEPLRSLLIPHGTNELKEISFNFFADLSSSWWKWEPLTKFKNMNKSQMYSNAFTLVRQAMNESFGFSTPRAFTFQVRINQLQRLFGESFDRMPVLKKQGIINDINKFRNMTVEERNLLEENMLDEFLENTDIAIKEYNTLLDDTAKLTLDQIDKRISKLLPVAKKGGTIRPWAPEGGPVGARWLTVESSLYKAITKNKGGQFQQGVAAAWYDSLNRQIILNKPKIDEFWESYKVTKTFAPNTLVVTDVVKTKDEFIDLILYHEINHINNPRGVKNGITDSALTAETPFQNELRMTEQAIKDLENLGFRGKTKDTIKDTTFGAYEISETGYANYSSSYLDEVKKNSNKTYIHWDKDVIGKTRESVLDKNMEAYLENARSESLMEVDKVSGWRTYVNPKSWGIDDSQNIAPVGYNNKIIDLNIQNLPATDNVLYISGGRNYARGGSDIHSMYTNTSNESKLNFRRTFEGTRSTAQTSAERKIMREAFISYIKKHGKPKLIVVGGAPGADTFTKTLANEFNIQTRTVEPDGITRNGKVFESWHNINHWKAQGAKTFNTIKDVNTNNLQLKWSDELIERYAKKITLPSGKLLDSDDQVTKIRKIGEMRALIVKWGQGEMGANKGKAMSNWDVHNAIWAGPARNQYVIDTFKPTHALTFDDGGSGTRSAKNMLRQRKIDSYEFVGDGRRDSLARLEIEEGDWDKTGIAAINAEDIQKIKAMSPEEAAKKGFITEEPPEVANSYDVSSANDDGFGHEFSALAAEFKFGKHKGLVLEEVWQTKIKDPYNVLKSPSPIKRKGNARARINSVKIAMRSLPKGRSPITIHREYIKAGQFYPWAKLIPVANPQDIELGVVVKQELTGDQIAKLYPDYYNTLKTKPADNETSELYFNYESLNAEYDKLWDEWALENPKLIEALNKKVENKKLIDTQLSKSAYEKDHRLVNSQAKSLANILTNRYGTVKAGTRGQKFTGNITRNMINNNKNILWIFGDNVASAQDPIRFPGRGGMAKEMRGTQVQIDYATEEKTYIPQREMQNTFGIRTKWLPDNSKEAFFNDADFDEIKQMIDEDIQRIPRGMQINLPWDSAKKEYNIGTGRAGINAKRTPKIYEYLQNSLANLENGGLTEDFIKRNPDKIFIIGDNVAQDNFYPFSEYIRAQKTVPLKPRDAFVFEYKEEEVIRVRKPYNAEAVDSDAMEEPYKVDQFGNLIYMDVTPRMRGTSSAYTSKIDYTADERRAMELQEELKKSNPGFIEVVYEKKGYDPKTQTGIIAQPIGYRETNPNIKRPKSGPKSFKKFNQVLDIEYVKKGEPGYYLAADVRDYPNVISVPLRFSAGARSGNKYLQEGAYFADIDNKINPHAKQYVDAAFEKLEVLKFNNPDAEIIIDEDSTLDVLNWLSNPKENVRGVKKNPYMPKGKVQMRKLRNPRAPQTMKYIKDKIDNLSTNKQIREMKETAIKEVPNDIPNLKILPELKEGMTNEDYIKELEKWFETIPHDKEVVLPAKVNADAAQDKSIFKLNISGQPFYINTPWLSDIARTPITERLENMFRFGGDLDQKRWQLAPEPAKRQKGTLKFREAKELNKLLAERNKAETVINNIETRKNPELIEETDYQFKEVNAKAPEAKSFEETEIEASLLEFNKANYHGYKKQNFAVTDQIKKSVDEGFQRIDSERVKFSQINDEASVFTEDGILKKSATKEGEFTFSGTPFFGNRFYAYIDDPTARLEAEKMQKDLISMQEYVDVHKIVAGLQRLNEVQRIIALGGDGSVFGIQLIQMWYYKPKIAGKTTKVWARTFVEALRDPRAAEGLAQKRQEDKLIQKVRNNMPQVVNSVTTPNESTAALREGGLLARIGRTRVGAAFKLALETSLDYAGDELAIALYPQIKRTLRLSFPTTTGARINVPESIVSKALSYKYDPARTGEIGRPNLDTIKRQLDEEGLLKKNLAEYIMVLNDPEFQQWARQNNLYGEDTNRILATIRRQPATEVAKRINTQNEKYTLNRLFLTTDKESLNFTEQLDPYSLKETSEFINYIRGITSSAEQGIPPKQRVWESIFLLAPRYRRAVAGMYAKLFSKDKLTRQEAQKSLVRFYGGLAATVISIQMMKSLIEGDSAEQMTGKIEGLLDPTSGSFMLFDVEGQKIGPGSKILSDMKIAAKASNYFWKELSGQQLEDWEDFTALDRDNPTLKWVRGQMAAAPSEAIDLMLGSDFIGEPAYRGENIVEKFENTARPLAQNAVPLWIWSALMENSGSLDWQSQVKGRITRGAGEFAGLRAFPQGASTILREASWDYYATNYDKLEPFQKELLQKLTNDHLEQIQKEQLERGTSDFAVYYGNLKRIDHEFHDSLKAYMTIYPDSPEGNRDLLFRFGKLKDYRRGQRKEVGVDIEFEEHDVNNKDPIKRALAQYYSLFDDPEVRVPNTNTINWIKWDDKYDILMATLTSEQQLAIMRNTDRLPLPRDFLERISRVGTGKEYTRLMQGQELRQDYLAGIGRPDLAKVYEQYFFMLED